MMGTKMHTKPNCSARLPRAGPWCWRSCRCLGAPRSWLLYIFLFAIYLTMANMWNLLAGYSGLVSLCQPAFLGLAGYTMVIGTWIGIPLVLRDLPRGHRGGALLPAPLQRSVPTDGGLLLHRHHGGA